jgi:hypothetical protein
MDEESSLWLDLLEKVGSSAEEGAQLCDFKLENLSIEKSIAARDPQSLNNSLPVKSFETYIPIFEAEFECDEVEVVDREKDTNISGVFENVSIDDPEESNKPSRALKGTFGSRVLKSSEIKKCERGILNGNINLRN